MLVSADNLVVKRKSLKRKLFERLEQPDEFID